MPFGNPLVAGETLVRAAVRSPNYVPAAPPAPGVGWAIRADGSAEFQQVSSGGYGFFTGLQLFNSGTPSYVITATPSGISLQHQPGGGSLSLSSDGTVILNNSDSTQRVRISPTDIFFQFDPNGIAGSPSGYRFRVDAQNRFIVDSPNGPTAGRSRVLLGSGAGGDDIQPGQVVAVLRAVATTSVPNNAAVQPITFDTADLDIFAQGGIGTPTYGLFEPTKYRPAVAGWYSIEGVVSYAAQATAVGYRAAWALKNGAFVVGSVVHIPAASGVQMFVPNGPAAVYLNGTTDYVGLGGIQTSGAALATVTNRSALNVVYRGNP